MIETIPSPEGLSAALTPRSKAIQTEFKNLLNGNTYLPSEYPYNITISEPRKFIWFRVAKVGTRSIFQMLTEAGFELTSEHAMACHYSPRFYKDYFKFAFVRNPWDRLISYYTYKKAKGQEGLGGAQTVAFRDWVQACLVDHDPAFWRPKYFVPQFDWIADADGKVLLDFVGKVENLDRDFAEICVRIGIDKRLGHRNKSERGDYRDYYDAETRRIVAEVFRKDIDHFGYTF